MRPLSSLHFFAFVLLSFATLLLCSQAGKHVDEDARKRIVFQRTVVGRSAFVVARDNFVTPRYVQALTRRWRANGHIYTQAELYGNRAGRPRIMTDDDWAIIRDIICVECVVHSDEIAWALPELGGNVISARTIRHNLRREGYTYNRIWRYSRRVLLSTQRLFWRYFRRLGLRTRQLVFIDESHVNGRNYNREYGWSLRGERPRFNYIWHRGTRYSIIGAANRDGLLDYTVITGMF